MNAARVNARKEKILRDQAHIDYLLAKGWHPLDIADQLLHYMVTGLREGIKHQYPALSEEAVQQKLREYVNDYDNLKSLRRGRINHRI